MTGGIGILNVGAGDTKLTFDKDNPAECIRAGRIVTDMLRRGYALLIEVNGKTERVKEFKPDTCEYIIADFDPSGEQHGAEQSTPAAAPRETGLDAGPALPKARRGPKPGTKTVDATGVSGVAVARTAGG